MSRGCVMRECTIQLLPHTADVGISVEAPTVAALFEQAALGMTSMMTNAGTIDGSVERSFVVTGEGYDELLVSWLSELLYALDAERQIFCRFQVDSITNTMLVARAWGEGFDPARHYRGSFVKAVTYHQLAVVQDEEGWRARVFFDI